jgi:hypothetical protein
VNKLWTGSEKTPLSSKAKTSDLVTFAQRNFGPMSNLNSLGQHRRLLPERRKSAKIRAGSAEEFPLNGVA